MKIEKWCDISDCPKHPDYSPPKIKEKKIEYDQMQNHNHIIDGWQPSYQSVSNGNRYYTAATTADHSVKWTLPTIDASMIFNTDCMDISIECFVCKYMKKQDMFEVIQINKAKELLKK